MIRVMFVCLGNICRSPMAEGVFQHLVTQANLSDKIMIDSSGTSSYHVGEPPHPGTRRVLQQHGINYQHRSQQVDLAQLQTADYVVAMDRSNLRALKQMARDTPELENKLSLLLDHAPGTERQDVPDPYYEGNFEKVYQLVLAGCEGLLATIRRRHNL